jgi:hypothetical protein
MIPPTFSFTVLFVLLMILVISGRVFHVLTQQWTTHRPGAALREWADEQDFLLAKAPIDLPGSLSGLKPLDPRIEILLNRGPLTMVRLTTAAKPTAPRPVWNLLIQESGNAKTPAALRPATAVDSIVDLFTLNGFPSLLPPERFVVFAADSTAARSIAGSPAKGLLPADIGLLVHGPYLTLDFSTRPFDAIEFNRMLAIVEQLIRFDTGGGRR